MSKISLHFPVDIRIRYERPSLAGTSTKHLEDVDYLAFEAGCLCWGIDNFSQYGCLHRDYLVDFKAKGKDN